MQGKNNVLHRMSLYIHLRCFEEKLKQVGDYHVESKKVAFFAQSNINHFHPLILYKNFIQSLDHEVFKDAMFLSKMFQSMLNFERKFNKEREEHDKKVIYFECHKERHIIHS
jgi:hypothetical protein